ncbi:DUF4817 domain-containing protein [Nephila pilipes]|uniref:DUF4817 domain-containing protein n=1 Tax=Nephila pilipes TaxID=299642 RepID=A0A8X6URL2_NEPPI|nr:DUF4817 domain-containing protein [Nephila pilipes]
MLSGNDKALLKKLFYMNEESVTGALRKFRLQKNVQTEKRPLTVAHLMKLVQRFEETGSHEDRCTGSWQTFGFPPSSIRNIFRGVLNQYPYKLQSYHEFLPSDIVEREALAMWALSEIEQDSSWVFCILWTDEGHFSIHGDVTTHYCRNWAKSLFEKQCPVNGWKKMTVNAQRYLTLLREKVVPCLREKDALSTVTFIQDGAITFGKERIISKRCKSP